MKWYLHRHHNLHLKDIKVKRGQSLELYYPWVVQIANTFPRDNVAIGALNLQDLVQAGYVGLVDAWKHLDHSKSQGEKWSYIKKRIKWSIKREIENYGAFIKIPRRDIDKANAKLSNVDKILVNIFPKFFDDEIIYKYDFKPYKIEQLGLILDDYLYSNFKNTDHVEILRSRFGIDRDKPLSIKELSIKYRKSEIGIKKIQQRMIESLRQDLEFTKIIKNNSQD